MASFALRLMLEDMRTERSAQIARDKAKMTLLGDPEKLDKVVGSFAEYLSPARKKAKRERYGLKTEAVDAMIPEGHAMKGYGQELREKFKESLAKPSLDHLHPQQILHQLATSMYAAPKEGDDKSRHVRSLEHKRMADTALLQWGDDPTVKKPPGYDVYRSKMNEAEIAAAEGETWLASPGDIAKSAAVFAAIDAGIAGVTTGGLAVPPAVVVGGATGALLELVGHPIRKAVKKTEWGRARMHSDSLVDRLKVELGSFVPELAMLPRIHKVVGRAVTVPKILAREAAAMPSADNILRLDNFQRGFVKQFKTSEELVEGLNQIIANTPGLGLGVRTGEDAMDLIKMLLAPPFRARDTRRALFKAIAAPPKRIPYFRPEVPPGRYQRILRDEPGIGMAEEAPIYEQFRTLDEVGIEEALTDPAGPGVGTRKAFDRQQSRNLATGVASMDEVEKGTVSAFKVSARTQVKATPAVVDQLGEAFEEISTMEARAVELGFPAEEIQVWKKTMQAETMEDLGATSEDLAELMRRPGPARTVISDTTGPISKELDAVIPEPTPSQMNDTVQIAADQAIALGAKEEEAAQQLALLAGIEKAPRGKYMPKELRLEARKGAPAYEISPKKAPALIKQDMEAMTADEIYDSVDAMEERLYKKYFPGKEYTRVPARVEETVESGIGEEWLMSTRERQLGADELVEKIDAETALLERKMSNAEYQARQAGLDMWERKMISEGRMQPGEAIPQMRSAEHYERVLGEQGDPWTPYTGWREVPSGSQVESRAAEEIRGNWLPVTEGEARALARDILGAESTGAITADEALHRMVQLEESILQSPNMTEAQKLLLREGLVVGDYVSAAVPESTAAIVTQLKKVVALTGFFSLMGAVPGMFYLFGGPKEAEAGVGGMVLRQVRRAARAVPTARAQVAGLEEAIAATAKEAGLFAPEVDRASTIIKAAQYQRGLMDTPAGGPTQVLKALDKWARDIKPGIRHMFMGPGMLFEEVLNVVPGKMNNPALFRISFQNAEYNNIRAADLVLDNILRETKIKGDPKTIGRAFEPLVPYQIKQIQQSFHQSEINRIAGDLKKLMKGKPDKVRSIDVDVAKEALAFHEGAVKEFTGATKEFHREWEKIAEPLARENPSFRVFLTTYDGPDFVKAPFMKNIKLSPNEQVAAGKWREWLLEYKTRLEQQGERTIKGPYAPTIMHPSAQIAFKDVLKSHPKAAAYMRIYTRAAESRPLMGDFPTTMMRYSRDIERRLQNMAFWESGWKTVETRTQHIPLLNQAFKLLSEGVRPVEMTTGNKWANIYVQAEAWKRLHLNPSAGGKHLMKMTGSMTTAGFKNTFQALGQATGHTSDRILNLLPGKMQELSKMGFRSQRSKNRLIRDWTRSMIPPRNQRQRLIDMGIFGEDELFSIWKQIWHRTQNVGAAWINFAELFDRGVSSASGLQMAAKRGMTAEQAYYGSLELMFKNNFFSRELNPAWMNNPKIRALFMFQGTPYKIFERRLVTAVRSGRAIKKMGKSVFEATKTAEGRTDLLRSIRTLRTSMKATEQEFKVNMIADALRSELDFFGTPVVAQTAKDILLTGALLSGGASVGMNLKHHIFHLPFFSGMTSDPVVSFSPGIMSAIRGHRAWQAQEADDKEFLFTKILKKWMGPVGPLPDVVWKGMRISKKDIPELYHDSRFRYLFAIPWQGKE